MSGKDESRFRLVWSDDPREKASKLDPVPRSAGTGWVAVFRIAKSGRGGKTVTVIDQLPKNEDFLRTLCRELKSKCGVGGTYSAVDGSIEIQGDKRQAIKTIFDQKSYRYKGM